MTNSDSPTLGEITDLLQPLKDQGITYESMIYVLERVWWEDMERRQRDTATFQKLTQEEQ